MPETMAKGANMEQHTRSVTAHYDSDDITQGILDALRQAGKDLDHLTIDDLAPLDEVHTRGREATVEIAGLTEITSGLNVVDVGSGVGGPARYLATEFGCRVTGIDLTPAFCAAATRLTELVGLSDRVTFENGSALEMPFEDGAFDLALTMQMQMNIADKPALYREIHRVLKPGGRLVFQDIVATPGGDIIIPVPWASAPEHSHLALPEELRAIIADAGFEEVLWRDATGAHKTWMRAQAARAATRPPRDAPPVLGIHLVLGPGADEKRANAGRCLMEDRTDYVQGVFRKAT